MNSKLKSFLGMIVMSILLMFSSIVSGQSVIEKKSQAEVLDLVFILDKSGSMSGFESDTIGGFNSVLTENRNKKGDVFITTVLFNDKTTLLHNREPINKVSNLTLEDYKVGSNTALLDAVGDTIIKMQENRKLTKNNNVLFVIITDGEENSSRKYSQDKIKSMIKSAEIEDKWDFIFLGANMDAIVAADNIGISRSKATSYVQDDVGYDKAYKAVNNAVESKKKAAPISEEWKKDVEADAMDRAKK
ncbi:VWA domain-containing protein [Providencia vermicola]|uniref:VWA domain-containing protein n=2 Tax=Providencia TaxID=586 RepID=A0AAI9I144_PROST|nr:MULTISPECIES: vWA domain-containing protein [Providencia]ELR5036319.1 VWA domain-containing protein [Providencia stuartii]ELR5122006.1 VWA domain-containing protein [Providencia stuartii]ELR5123459.1 VWA domain-containing protein [Providencia stuartii]ELR5140728.1 VWA domain-containing protein [Providencia stuartii]ELX8379486.1 VWA domain-containing protein [Providencia stuartii]